MSANRKSTENKQPIASTEKSETPAAAPERSGSKSSVKKTAKSPTPTSHTSRSTPGHTSNTARSSPNAKIISSRKSDVIENKSLAVTSKSPDVTAKKSDVTSNRSSPASKSPTRKSPGNMFIEEALGQPNDSKQASRFDGLYVSDDGFLRPAVDPLGHVIESCPRLTLRINELMDQAVDIDSDLGFSKKRLLPDYYYTSTVPTTARPGGAEGGEEGAEEAAGGVKPPGGGKGKKKGGGNAVKVDIKPGCFAKAPSVFEVIYVPPIMPQSELKMVDFMPADVPAASA